MAGNLAKERKERGVKLNYVESLAYISSELLELARDGKTVVELMQLGTKILTKKDVMDGVADMLEEVQQCFINIALEIAKRDLLLIVTPEPEKVKQQITATVNMNNVRFLQCATNDTWARDHGAITMIDTGTPSLLDFALNGW